MLTRHKPDLKFTETISHPTEPARVAGFRARDRLRGVDCIVLKGELLPGDDCVGVYNKVVDELVEEGKLLFVLGTDEKVYGTVPDNVDAAPVQTFEDVPISGTATMTCVTMNLFAEWDGYTSDVGTEEVDAVEE